MRAVLSAVYWCFGGGRSVEFFRNFRHTYLSGFYRYNSDQESKSIPVIKRIDWRVLAGRAETAPPLSQP